VGGGEDAEAAGRLPTQGDMVVRGPGDEPGVQVQERPAPPGDVDYLAVRPAPGRRAPRPLQARAGQCRRRRRRGLTAARRRAGADSDAAERAEGPGLLRHAEHGLPAPEPDRDPELRDGPDGAPRPPGPGARAPAAAAEACRAGTQDNHIYTSGATGTNAAVIRGALRAEKPHLLTVVLPQSRRRQPPESRELLEQARPARRGRSGRRAGRRGRLKRRPGCAGRWRRSSRCPRTTTCRCWRPAGARPWGLRGAAPASTPARSRHARAARGRMCNQDIVGRVQQVICFAFHDSRLLLETCADAQAQRKIVTLFYLD